jgi:hypothetical protein
MRSHLSFAVLVALTATLPAQQPPQTNSSVLDANGTAHITRVIPVPTTISPEAQTSLRRPAGTEDQTLAERRTTTDAWQTRAGEASRKAYPVNIESLTIAGVPVRNILPLDPAHIALYGTSAGAILTAEVAVRLKQLNLPLPGALGIFSGMGDLSQDADSQGMYGLRGLTGNLPVTGTQPRSTEYTGTADPKDPVLSPLYADLHAMPPTLFITSGRDLLLSGTTILHRAFLRNGDDARLIVFEALPHAFWNDISLPETKEAYNYMADFFSQQLSR